jgi:predicted PP-loop superfamily ATPase
MLRKVHKKFTVTNSPGQTSSTSKIILRQTVVTSTREISTIKLHLIAEIFKFLKNGLLIELLQLFY